MSLSISPARVWRLSERAVLLEFSDDVDVAAFARSLQEGTTMFEIVNGISTMLISSDDVFDENDLAELLQSEISEISALQRTRHLIDVVLDGDDVTEVLELCKLTHKELVQTVESTEFTVACIGFAPGFAYLSGLEGPLATLERRATPRARVPEGSFAIAAGFAAFYPQASPGGWWLLGRSSMTFFDPSSVNPSLLQAGDLVKLRSVPNLPSRPFQEKPRPQGMPQGVHEVLEIVAAPPGCSVVDQGRIGLAALGVPRGGPADPERAGLLQQVLGDTPGALEISGSGFETRVLAPAVLAVLDLDLLLDGRLLPEGIPVSVHAGQHLSVDRVGRGHRGYLGIHGGPIVPSVLGSSGTCSLSGLGPRWLSPGDVIGSVGTELHLRGRVQWRSEIGTQLLRFLPGPHLDALEGGLEVLRGLEAKVATSSNRVGLRLEPRGGPLRRRARAVASLPVVTGAIQLPPDGNPVILGVDHATLGGYPLLGVVIDADLGRLGRCAAGDSIELQPVTLQEAKELSAKRRAQLTTWFRA